MPPVILRCSLPSFLLMAMTHFILKVDALSFLIFWKLFTRNHRLNLQKSYRGVMGKKEKKNKSLVPFRVYCIHVFRLFFYLQCLETYFLTKGEHGSSPVITCLLELELSAHQILQDMQKTTSHAPSIKRVGNT